MHDPVLSWRARAALLCAAALCAGWPGMLSFAQEGAGAPAAEVQENYVISANDLLDIRVYREEDMTTAARVGQDGYITFPLIGQVKVSGLTVPAAQREIQRRLEADYLVNPQVSVSVREYAKRRIVILGQVQRPGAYTLPGEEPLDVIEAIGLAGGFTRLAAPKNVILKRTENGRETVFRLDTRDMAGGRAKPFAVQPGDIITVSERLF